MRRIKFRVFDRMHKCMHIVGADQHDSMQIGDDNEVFYYNYQCGEGSITYDEEMPEDNSGFILMQYTGLKDKNGKEIYEGDIVDCKRGIDNETWIECIVIKDIRNLPTSLFGSNLVSREVIGNIYENPELLEE